jgi:hypothetical protein
MKKLMLFFFMAATLISATTIAQPQGFSYQTVVRDNSGNPITNQQVKFRFTIFQNTTSVYVETDTITTNDFGLVNLVIGEGTVVSGDFSSIDWSGDACSLQVELDLQDGNGYHNMGTTAFTSVPYAQYAESTGTTLAAGHNGEIQFNKNDSLSASPLLLWNDTGRLVIKAPSTVVDSLPLFEVKDKDGKTVFAVFNNGVHVYVDKEAKKRSYGAYKGGFVVSGKNSGAKANNDILVVNADSTRVFTQDEKAGFGVVGVSAKRGTSSSYMHINPSNYFIGESSGQQITTGTNNATFGYETGKSLTSGNANNFMGNQAGYSNTTGYYNNFIGYQAGYSNTSGYNNNFIGVETGYSNTTGCYNNFIGTTAGHSLKQGTSNNFMGDRAGYFMTNGSSNVYIGDDAGYNNKTGNNNVFLGARTAWYDTLASYNVIIGADAAHNNMQGEANVFLGSSAAYYNVLASGNIFIGANTGFNITGGDKNIILGYLAGPASDTIINNRLFINNDTADFPLIYGEFDNKIVAFNGKVGVGVQTPNEILEIGGDGRAFFGDGGGSSRKGLLVDGVESYGVKLQAWHYSVGEMDLVLNPSGNGKIGIGTTNPSHMLTISSRDDSLALRLIGSGSAGSKAMLNFGDGNYVYLQEYQDDYLKIYARKDILLTTSTGNVGIGTTSPDKLLTVDGDARVTGNIYYGTGSDTYNKPDFVFKPDYTKKFSVLSVEKYIRRHGHLPWVTAAKDEKDGVNMTRMSFETLEAVENQQLQIIELKKENEQLAKQNEQLKRQDEYLAKQNREILKRLKRLEKKVK